MKSLDETTKSLDFKDTIQNIIIAGICCIFFSSSLLPSAVGADYTSDREHIIYTASF